MDGGLNMNIEEKKVLLLVKKVLNGNFHLNEETNLINNGMDSIKVVQLLVLLEESFAIEFMDEDLQMKYFISVSEIAKLVKKKVEDKG